MSRTSLLVSGPLLAFAVAAGLAALSSAAAPEARVGALRPAQIQAIERAASQTASANFHMVVSQRFNATLDQGAIAEHLTALQSEFNNQNGGAPKGAVPEKGNMGGTPVEAVLLLYADPGAGNAAVPMQVGLTVPASLRRNKVKAPLSIVNVNSANAVRYQHRGAYEQLRAAGPRLVSSAKFNWGAGNRNGPVGLLRLLTDPTKVPAAQNQSEVVLLK